MSDTQANLEAPRFEDRKSFLVAGLTDRYNNQSIGGIPAQWQRFAPHIGKIPGQIGWTCYGVCFNFDGAGNMDYLCGVEIAEGSLLPDSLSELRIAKQKYAVFLHRGHISKIKSTWDSICGRWMLESGYKAADRPLFVVYGPDFDPQTGNGGVEIWIPFCANLNPNNPHCHRGGIC